MTKKDKSFSTIMGVALILFVTVYSCSRLDPQSSCEFLCATHNREYSGKYERRWGFQIDCYCMKEKLEPLPNRTP